MDLNYLRFLGITYSFNIKRKTEIKISLPHVLKIKALKQIFMILYLKAPENKTQLFRINRIFFKLSFQTEHFIFSYLKKKK